MEQTALLTEYTVLKMLRWLSKIITLPPFLIMQFDILKQRVASLLMKTIFFMASDHTPQ